MSKNGLILINKIIVRKEMWTNFLLDKVNVNDIPLYIDHQSLLLYDKKLKLKHDIAIL